MKNINTLKTAIANLIISDLEKEYNRNGNKNEQESLKKTKELISDENFDVVILLKEIVKIKDEKIISFVFEILLKENVISFISEDKNYINGFFIDERYNLLNYAILNSNFFITNFLVEKININEFFDEVGPLFLAVSKIDIPITNLLLKNGINVDYKNKFGDTVLTYLIKIQKISREFLKYKEILNLILTKSPNLINIQNDEGNTPLIESIIQGADKNLDFISFLVDNWNADVNIQNYEGDTALIYSASYDYKNITHYLINNGAEINFVNNNGDSALIIAVSNKNDEIVFDLLRANADINIMNKKGETFLYLIEPDVLLEIQKEGINVFKYE